MKRLRRYFLAAATAASLATALSGCAPLLLGGAAMTAMVATDRRTSGAQLEDETIELKASRRIRDALGDRVHVVVTSFNRQVLLTGEVPDQVTRETVEQIVRKVDNVSGVINELGIQIISSLSQRSNDLLIATKVRARSVKDRRPPVVDNPGLLYPHGGGIAAAANAGALYASSVFFLDSGASFNVTPRLSELEDVTTLPKPISIGDVGSSIEATA
jgi:osmotically-inducible protein OsmY